MGVEVCAANWINECDRIWGLINYPWRVDETYVKAKGIWK
jgi:transposase-like protein